MERSEATLRDIFDKLKDLPIIQVGELTRLTEINNKALGDLTLSDITYVQYLATKYGRDIGIEIKR